MNRTTLAFALAAALLLAACDDDTGAPDLTPEPDSDRYDDGPFAPCEVQLPPGDPDPQGHVALADVPDGAWLPAARVGALSPYSAKINGSDANDTLSGELPPGLSLTGGVLSGVPDPEAAPNGLPGLYQFTVADRQGAPLLTSLSVYPAAPAADPDLPRYWEPGPYTTWNTQPTPQCPMNPTIPQVGETENVDIYITYPTMGAPQEAGEAPVAAGRWPVVVFAHANSDRQCDINEHYPSLQDHWASWGWIVVAVDGTALNCMSGSRENVDLRSQGQLLALERLQALDQDPDSAFAGRVDLSRVVLAGHSRGGGASLWSGVQFRGVRGVIDLQGIDLTSFGFGSDPLPGWPVLGVTAGEDVDLNFPIVEPTEDQLSGPYTWVNLFGGIHAYTADTAPIEPDDVPLITQQQQHDLTEFYTTAFLARWVGVGDGSAPMTFAPDPAADPVLFGPAGAALARAMISDRGVAQRWHRRARGLLIDDFNRAPGPPGANLLGGAYELTGDLTAALARTYVEESGNTRPAYEKARSLRLEAGAQGGALTIWLDPDREGAAVDPGAWLQARVRHLRGQPPAALRLRVQADAGEADLDGLELLGDAPLSDRFTQLSLPLRDDPALADAASLRSITIELQGGVIFLDDLRIE